MKYQTDLKAIQNCPPQSCTKQERMAFRFVFDPLTADSFLPPGKIKPRRVHKERDTSKKCSLLALSMFTSEAEACACYNVLRSFNKNIDKAIGSHLATGEIGFHHGLADKPNNNGHFDFFEYKGVDLTADFSAMYKLSGK